MLFLVILQLFWQILDILAVLANLGYFRSFGKFGYLSNLVILPHVATFGKICYFC
jgi:hypothetical protein